MDTLLSHLPAAREVQYALATTRQQLLANTGLLTPSALLDLTSERPTPDESAALDLAAAEQRFLKAQAGDAWTMPAPQLPSPERDEPGESTTLIYGYGKKHAAEAAYANPAATITGPRNALSSSLELARQLAREWIGLGLPLVLGIDNGIEAAAARAALEVNPQLVTLVMGSAPQIAFPLPQRDLHKHALNSGASVISRTPHVAQPIPHSAHLRNLTRIPLTNSAVVIETRPAPSVTHAFITTALTNGVPLYVTPGDPLLNHHDLAHHLIATGRAQILPDPMDLHLARNLLTGI